MSSISTESMSTVHYAKPVIQHVSSSNNSPAKTPPRSPNIRYPTVVVNTPKYSPSYAVPAPRNYSTSQLQYEHMRHRCKMLNEENQKLMRMQSDVVTDANRRIEIHMDEIRMLKEENRKLGHSNKELRDLCCFLDDDRQKTRRLCKEWQKFGRYTSNLMRQEVNQYHKKQAELEEKLISKKQELDELKQLCLYLDEQRQYLMTTHGRNDVQDDVSEDLGCGGSEKSGASNEEKDCCYNQHKESTLRRISEQMANSMTSSTLNDRREESKKERSRLLGYIQSLENRIKHLELSQHHDGYWQSSSNAASECDEKTIIERWYDEETEPAEENEVRITKNQANGMIVSSSSTMTSSGTTYGSSGTDAESVYVMGDEIDIGNLEVRVLPRIEEEKGSDTSMHRSVDQSTVVDESARMPPAMAPSVCSSILSVSQLDPLPTQNSLMRSSSETCRPTTVLVSTKNTTRSSSVEKRTE